MFFHIKIWAPCFTSQNIAKSCPLDHYDEAICLPAQVNTLCRECWIQGSSMWRLILNHYDGNSKEKEKYKCAYGSAFSEVWEKKIQATKIWTYDPF